MSLLWEEGWALSSRRDRRQHAVWETAWKSASVNTPRPHVLPGQRAWPLSRHICTQSLSFEKASQEDRAGRAKEGEERGESEEFPDRENLLLLWRQCQWWKRYLRGTTKGSMHREDHKNLLPVCKVNKDSVCEDWPPSLQLYICITPLNSHAKVFLAAIITQPAHILERRWITV